MVATVFAPFGPVVPTLIAPIGARFQRPTLAVATIATITALANAKHRPHTADVLLIRHWPVRPRKRWYVAPLFASQTQLDDVLGGINPNHLIRNKDEFVLVTDDDILDASAVADDEIGDLADGRSALDHDICIHHHTGFLHR
ncbi:MAG TPA: hypothetical protein VGI99_12925, partial [Gemmataceae bacterium]